jgi:hypothetical protein
VLPRIVRRVVLAALIVWGGLFGSPGDEVRRDARSAPRLEADAAAAAELQAAVAPRVADAVRALVGPRRSGSPALHGIGPAVPVEHAAPGLAIAPGRASLPSIDLSVAFFTAASPRQPRAPPAST